MGKFALSTENRTAIWNYKRMYVVGALGFIEKQLGEIDFKREEFEISPVQKEKARDFLALFQLNPAVDITLIRGCINDASIVTYNLDAPPRKTLEKIIQVTGFEFYYPTKDFLDTIQAELEVLEVQTYHMCELISKKMGCSFDVVFNAIKYSNFLRYVNLKPEEARERVYRTFGFQFL